MVGSDAHIFEYVGSDEEVIIAGIGAEARTTGNLRRGSECLERRAQVDGRLSDGGTAQRSSTAIGHAYPLQRLSQSHRTQPGLW